MKASLRSTTAPVVRSMHLAINFVAVLPRDAAPADQRLLVPIKNYQMCFLNSSIVLAKKF